MNKNKLKVYAQAARREFIKAVTEKANLYGITEKSIAPGKVDGDFIIIDGRPFPKQVDAHRAVLKERINRKGFAFVMEENAYTWFNRFAAIRYMEIHGFLSHGYRVLSHPSGIGTPEILEKAQYVDMNGLDKEEVIKLKMDGTKDEELYCKLLIAECNQLSEAMPFLFEKVRDYTELLLPGNLLHSDSIIRKMVNEIDEQDWQEVEIIGWLYQFYISEKKDEVIGKVVKSEDIPAATQLFTPNWIVKYLVQNSLGAHWLRTYPNSALKSKMEYHIEPADQLDDVNAKIKEITPETLNPEELTLLDPASGSGHILVEGYDLLKEIYLERGYRKRDIPKLILTKNLFGLEIDDRAAQLAGFALMMKARGDDRGIFEKHIQPNVVSIKESNGMESRKDLGELIELFKDAKTFGSLIRIPEDIIKKLQNWENTISALDKSGNLFKKKEAESFAPFLRQAKILSRKYDAVVANPPYMGGKGMNAILKDYAKSQYPDTKSDLFAMFIERGFELAKESTGHNAMVTMQSWMFLSSFEKMREKLFEMSAIRNMVHMSNGVMGIAFGTNATVWFNKKLQKYKGSFSYVDYSELTDRNIPKEFPIKNNRLKDASSDDFKKIPGSPIAYWVSEKIRKVFEEKGLLSSVAMPRQGLATGENERFVRTWQEVSQVNTMFACESIQESVQSKRKWFPYNKGGDFRRWWGNQEFVVNWHHDGKEIRNYVDENGKLRSRPQNIDTYFHSSVSWSKISSGQASFRLFPEGFIYDVAGTSIFAKDKNQLLKLLGFANSYVTKKVLEILSPTLNFEVGHIASLPFNFDVINQDSLNNIETIISITKDDWNAYEISWDFIDLPILRFKKKDLNSIYHSYLAQCQESVDKMKQLEEENNRIFIKAYGLLDEISPEVPIEEITLFANPKYRFRGELTDEQLEERFKSDTVEELISYSIGCMMGRYSLDKPGLIYAHSGNKGFDSSQYKTFPADDDGIIPITDREWFDDDAACRFFQFIEAVWGRETLEDNLEFIADSIGRKTNESAREAVRRYFVNEFFKDHLKTYKKRPIYWLFTSGKEKAFQALVYLHRYNEGTLSRMRTEYVLPLQSKITVRIKQLADDIEHASSTSASNKINKEITKLRQHHGELLHFDEKLRHFADKKIKLDLDDGVKVNYGKFGELLEAVNAVTGKK